MAVPEAERDVFQNAMDGLTKLNKLVEQGISHNSPHIHNHVQFGGISQWLSFILTIVLGILLLLSNVWWMLQNQAVRAEHMADQKAAADREIAWVGTWTQRVETLRAELRAEKEKRP